MRGRPAGGRNPYLATVIDGHSQRPADWTLADDTRTDLIADASRRLYG